MKKSFMFTNKEHTLKGIMATILGMISIASLGYIIVNSYRNDGQVPLQYGAVAFLTMLFAFAGIVLGVLSKSERDKFYFFSYLGIVLNVLVLAALSVRHVSTRWSGFGAFARRAPYASAALIVLVGLYTSWLGWTGLRHEARDHTASSGPILRP